MTVFLKSLLFLVTMLAASPLAADDGGDGKAKDFATELKALEDRLADTPEDWTSTRASIHISIARLYEGNGGPYDKAIANYGQAIAIGNEGDHMWARCGLLGVVLKTGVDNKAADLAAKITEEIKTTEEPFYRRHYAKCLGQSYFGHLRAQGAIDHIELSYTTLLDMADEVLIAPEAAEMRLFYLKSLNHLGYVSKAYSLASNVHLLFHPQYDLLQMHFNREAAIAMENAGDYISASTRYGMAIEAANKIGRNEDSHPELLRWKANALDNWLNGFTYIGSTRDEIESWLARTDGTFKSDDPMWPTITQSRGWLLEAIGESARAEEAYRDVLYFASTSTDPALRPLIPALSYPLVVMLQSRESYNEAIQLIDTALGTGGIEETNDAELSDEILAFENTVYRFALVMRKAAIYAAMHEDKKGQALVPKFKEMAAEFAERFEPLSETGRFPRDRIQLVYFQSMLAFAEGAVLRAPDHVRNMDLDYDNPFNAEAAVWKSIKVRALAIKARLALIDEDMELAEALAQDIANKTAFQIPRLSNAKLAEVSSIPVQVLQKRLRSEEPKLMDGYTGPGRDELGASIAINKPYVYAIRQFDGLGFLPPNEKRQRARQLDPVFDRTIDVSWDMVPRMMYSSEDIQAGLINGWTISLPETDFRDPPDEDILRAFGAAQYAMQTSTADVLAKANARFASRDDDLGRLARRQQDLQTRLNDISAAMASRIAGNASEKAALPALRDKYARELKSVQAEIREKFPAYFTLSRNKPISAADAAAILGDDEAIVQIHMGPENTYVWIITSKKLHWYKAKEASDDIKVQIFRLRAGLSGAAHKAKRGFNLDIAHDLYKTLLQPGKQTLKGIKHLHIVTDGALQSLPLALLLASPPPVEKAHKASPAERNAAYQQADWLIRHYSMSVSPSIASLAALRKLQKEQADADARYFLGIGNPVLLGRSGKGTVQRGGEMTGLFRDGKVNIETVRKLTPLPETEDELREIAQTFPKAGRKLLLQNQATEIELARTLKQSKPSVVMFATHGLLAGELRGLAEPALVTTPPPPVSAPANDNAPPYDGLLTVSEISQLELNADWVILSACNTAGGNGEPGADGLSGLAQAFFYAGARSLYVSHWPVNSDATVNLTTGIFADLSNREKGGKAEAVQQAMLDLITAPPFEGASHPGIWAPFILVGDR